MLLTERNLKELIKKSLFEDAEDDDFADEDEDYPEGSLDFSGQEDYKGPDIDEEEPEKKKGRWQKWKEKRAEKRISKKLKAEEEAFEKEKIEKNLDVDLTGVTKLKGDVYSVADPLTGDRKHIRGEDEARTYKAKRSMMADKQKSNKDYYKKMKDDDPESSDPLKDRTSYYGGLDFDKFFEDILAGKKTLYRGKRAKVGTHTWRQIVAIQSLYNDMEFPGAKKKFDNIGVDGDFGRKTRDAIKDLQAYAKTMSGAFKNTKVDGVIGRQTIGLFDPSKSPLPITGADTEKAISKAQKK